MSRFKVAPGKLDEVAGEMFWYHFGLRMVLAQVDSLFQRLPEAWDSEGAQKAQSVNTHLQENFDALGEHLVKLTTFLGDAADGYQTAINNNKEMWQVP